MRFANLGLLLQMGDGVEGWRVVYRLIRKLEEAQIKDLTFPLEVGKAGPDRWVIG
jgi:hypothetical protein